MEIKVRNVPEDVGIKLAQQASKQKISREEYIRRILYSTSLNTSENNLFHFRTEVMQKLASQIEYTNKILEMFGEKE
ncbi:hypothetical protein J0J36_10315 (plasmid) [Lactococcus sp. LG1074]|uniref:FitA-like ribbon-helix-helix domain-containing protein n=1 Tax=Lactococcus TaxID=1357 RepID=UPI001A8D7E3C|nr:MULTISPECIES: hypothetical protein [Lactococcus]QSR03114.1 hypothetical protein J0J36_10315 [Lactococcus sp. LG1074]